MYAKIHAMDNGQCDFCTERKHILQKSMCWWKMYPIESYVLYLLMLYVCMYLFFSLQSKEWMRLYFLCYVRISSMNVYENVCMYVYHICVSCKFVCVLRTNCTKWFCVLFSSTIFLLENFVANRKAVQVFFFTQAPFNIRQTPTIVPKQISFGFFFRFFRFIFFFSGSFLYGHYLHAIDRYTHVSATVFNTKKKARLAVQFYVVGVLHIYCCCWLLCIPKI